MKKHGIIFLFLWIPFLSNAQEYWIKGTVTDNTGAPLEAATIVLLKDSTTLVKTETSQEKGVFLLESIPSGSYALKVMLGGYETYSKNEIALTNNVDLGDIKLLSKSQQLKDVTVTVQRPLIQVKPDKLVLNVDNSITSGAFSYGCFTKSTRCTCGSK